MWWLYLCIGLLGAVVGQDGQAANLTVTIEQGPVRGYKTPGTNIFTFYGIPYAVEPIGTEKFRAPLPAPTWTDIFEAVDDFILCPQLGVKIHHENCLIANVYVPDTPETDLPVLVLVHGGAFQFGFGNEANPFGLLEKQEMIVVNFNYRLGAHGFLCLGTEDAPGNAGMKDQLALLRWVKKNIEAFGGNPDDITIVGCSAGGVSVDLLRVVNVTDGLFNKVITESGSSVGTFGVQMDPIENAKIYARVLGFDDVDNVNALEEFYKTASIELLYSRIDQILSRVDSTVLFVPCIEKDIGVERFLEEAPVNIIKRGLNKVLPALYGFAEKEGLMHIGYFEDWSVRMNASFVEFVPADLEFESDEEKSIVAHRIRNFYFGEGPITEDSRIPFIDFISDVLFIYSMLRSVKLHATTRTDDSFYIYEYSFINELTQNYPGGVRGANHCEQIMAVFDEDETNLEQEYKEMKNFMRNIYVNFITTGTPIVNGSPLPILWVPANANRDPHLAIGANVNLKGPVYEERVAFWDEIYENYYRSPIPPNHVSQDIVANRTVFIEQGPVRGYKAPGTNIFTFYGIPYAVEPTGTEKFRAPLPAPTWTDIFEAVDDFILCPQPSVEIHHENCLIANLYVPDTTQTDLPVLVSVHGGAFQYGFGNYEKPFGLLEKKDMIVVNFNYRLGAHGFLCLGTEDVPGNAGMKDQLALLRWVKKNIEAFGGNPDDITIVGCSAGGVSVDLLRIVNVTDGLFNKVITESGSSVGTFGVQIDPIENAKIYARVLGFDNVDNINALEEFYKNASIELLYSRTDQIIDRIDSSVLFVPCVEKDIGVERFLEEAPVNIIKRGLNKVLPALYGFAEKEGLMQIDYFEDWSVRMNASFVEFVPADLEFESDEEKSIVAQRIRNFYFGEGPITEDSRIPFIDFISDVLFIYSMLRSVKLHTTTRTDDSFYIYEYSFINELTQNYPGGVRGANHCEQIMAVFDEDETNLEQEYKDMKSFMRNVYINFITTGTPIVNGSPLPVTWGPANANRDPHLAIGANVTLEGPTYEERAAFWDDIYENYYRSPIPPDSGSVVTIVSYFCVICSILATFSL